ncbi:helix-turn-helix domain-containing protein [Clostridium tetani]|uniref:XRE family transcriptional regulator n=1 Tax=Clostridium tetani TaxID=1513 RepID=A0ABY0ES83_CLOTA|nr:helix-turn-helix transcriptional regulator [Clostridium tetani]RXI55491.1 XRE family transcriptional regulator [Clostridium tetani]RXI68562.1 XRE family transcriptional regulator [Clostridium tetani]
MTKTEKLKHIILSKYNSIREFARIAGIPSTTLTSALDKDIGGMAVDRVIKICEILNVDIKTLEPLDQNLINNNLSKKETTLLTNFNKLNETGKDEAIKRVEELTQIDKYTHEEKDHLMPIAAHDKEGKFSKEDMEHDLNLMKDDELWK